MPALLLQKVAKVHVSIGAFTLPAPAEVLKLLIANSKARRSS